MTITATYIGTSTVQVTVSNLTTSSATSFIQLIDTVTDAIIGTAAGAAGTGAIGSLDAADQIAIAIGVVAVPPVVPIHEQRRTARTCQKYVMALKKIFFDGLICHTSL